MLLQKLYFFYKKVASYDGIEYLFNSSPFIITINVFLQIFDLKVVNKSNLIYKQGRKL